MKQLMQFHRLRIVAFALLSCAVAFAGFAQAGKDAKPKPAQSIPELRQQLEKILADTHTPGVSVAIVHKDGPEWVAGLGKSDAATNQAATDETLLRIGSTSKAFVSLSLLKLANEGKLSLLDPVHKIVPEIWFRNRWEDTDPVRVVDLVEHTTGWDDMHLPEYAKDAKGMTLRQGLDYYRKSRISRWRPGTRMAYCNSGPAVAAYVVEKITGKRFEDYVTQNFFLPIGMKTATYFEQPSTQLTTLYQNDGKTPFPYWNILLRPAGAINASAKDMAAYVQFYLNRGTANGVEVMPAASIDRMETPTRTWEAQQGLKAGYGMSNDAFGKVGDAIRAYVTRNLARQPVPPAGALPADAAQYAGWYLNNSPRVEMTHFLNLLTLSRVSFDGHNLLLSSLGQHNQPFAPVSGEQFRYLPKKDPPEPIATALLIAPNAEGRFAYLGGTMKKIPTWVAWLAMALTAWFVLALAAVVLYAPFWIFSGLIKRRRRPAERAMRLWPLIAVFSILAFVGCFAGAGADQITRLGNLTVWSFGIFFSTLLFAFASLASAYALWRARGQQIRGFVRWFSIAVTAALMIATVYLAYWGIIGMRTWA